MLPIPTNRPAIRQRLPDRVFGTRRREMGGRGRGDLPRCTPQGRPVLIGTRSIDKSEHLSDLLDDAGHRAPGAQRQPHRRGGRDRRRAPGSAGKVTVSTNMAGRGTDIKLGEGVLELGGLHVICTEMHDSSRIDRQLIGRCGRQGDPGTFRQYLALDDELLLAGLGPDKSRKLKELGEQLRRPVRPPRPPVPQGPAEGRAPPLPRPQSADVLREGTEEDAAADGAGPVPRHAGLDGYNCSVGGFKGRLRNEH